MKILILKNKLVVNVDDDIEKAFSYIKEKSGGQFIPEITVKETNIPFNIIFNQFETGSNFAKKQYGTDARSKVEPLTNGYDVAIFMFPAEEQMPDGYVTSSAKRQFDNGCQYFEIITNPFNDQTGWIWKSLAHEMMHVLSKAFNALGARMVDEMDMTLDGKAYWNNQDPYAPQGNYQIMFDKFAPFWGLLSNTVTIERLQDEGTQTRGILRVGSFSAKTIELPWKNNQPNISCIPKGTYQVRWTFSPRFLKYTYEIQNVPHRSGIRIHSANYARQLNGCVALGDRFADIDKDGKLDVANSRITIKAFEDKMNRKQFTLIVK